MSPVVSIGQRAIHAWIVPRDNTYIDSYVSSRWHSSCPRAAMKRRGAGCSPAAPTLSCAGSRVEPRDEMRRMIRINSFLHSTP